MNGPARNDSRPWSLLLTAIGLVTLVALWYALVVWQADRTPAPYAETVTASSEVARGAVLVPEDRGAYPIQTEEKQARVEF